VIATTPNSGDFQDAVQKLARAIVAGAGQSFTGAVKLTFNIHQGALGRVNLDMSRELPKEVTIK